MANIAADRNGISSPFANSSPSFEDLLANQPKFEVQGSQRLVPLIFVYPEKSFKTGMDP